MHRNYALREILLGRTELKIIRWTVLDALMGEREGEAKKYMRYLV
jgi:hypothetical protein